MNDDATEVVDLTGYFEEPEQVPLCPICGQPLEYYLPIGMFKAYGYLALAHVECIADAREELNI